MKRAILPPPPAELVIVREASVPKLSARAEGLISYKIGFVPDRSEVYFSLTGNEGGGYFSREWIPLSRVVAVLADLAGAQPFAAIALKSAFIGKSVNNPSFLAAVLVAEQVIKADAEKPSKLNLANDAGAWRENFFAMTGPTECFEQPQAQDQPNPDAGANSGKGKKGKRKATNAEAGHEDHPQPE